MVVGISGDLVFVVGTEVEVELSVVRDSDVVVTVVYGDEVVCCLVLVICGYPVDVASEILKEVELSVVRGSEVDATGVYGEEIDSILVVVIWVDPAVVGSEVVEGRNILICEEVAVVAFIAVVKLSVE